MNQKSVSPIFGLASLLILGSTSSLSGAALYWDVAKKNGLSTSDGSWSTTVNNWNTSATPNGNGRGNWTNSSDAYFNPSGTSLVTLSEAVTVNSITFNGTGYTIAGPAAGVEVLTLTGTGTITVNADAAISARVGGTAGLTKLGAATLTLSGANTYTGSTSINNGTLIVNGTQGSATGAVSVASIAKLLGTGTIGGSTTVLGTQSAGASAAAVGTQTFSSALNYSTGSIFEWDINVSGATETHDKIIAGSLSGSGAQFKIQLASGDSYGDTFWNSNRNWTAIDLFGANNAAVNLSNIFSNLSSTGNSLEGSFSFTSTGGGTGNQLTWTAVPEPTSALAALLLGAGLLGRNRSRHQLR